MYCAAVVFAMAEKIELKTELGHFKCWISFNHGRKHTIHRLQSFQKKFPHIQLIQVFLIFSKMKASLLFVLQRAVLFQTWQTNV